MGYRKLTTQMIKAMFGGSEIQRTVYQMNKISYYFIQIMLIS